MWKFPNCVEKQILPLLMLERLWISCAAEIGNLSELRRLNVHTNRLNGNIPASLGNCSNLHAIYLFENDFSALQKEEVNYENKNNPLFRLKPERGINKVVCFSPKHNLTLPEMDVAAIEKVVQTWAEQYIELGSHDYINYVQIFENKGSVMGCSNPHPHGQIWAQSSLPTQVEKTQKSLRAYYEKNNTSLLKDYLDAELKKEERVVLENNHFAVVVPFWAIWPYETMNKGKRFRKGYRISR